jgi:hypothetical protein
VFPANDLGPRPTSGSVLVFEQCDGDWTADLAWLDRRDDQRRPAAIGADQGAVGRGAARSCVWVTQENGPVVPQELFLAAPSADAALVFEYCDAEWTGDMAWLESREQLPTSDDGLPNPWEAGNRAVERWLEGRTGHDPSGWRGP